VYAYEVMYVYVSRGLRVCNYYYYDGVLFSVIPSIFGFFPPLFLGRS